LNKGRAWYRFAG